MLKIFNLRIFSKSELKNHIINAFKEGFDKGWDKSKETTLMIEKSYINPVIHDLEKLRANTWDQNKITHIQNWLRNAFENSNNQKENNNGE